MVAGPFKENLVNRLMAWRKTARSAVSSDTLYDVVQPIAKAGDNADDRLERLENIVKTYLGPNRTRNVDGTKIPASDG